MPPLGPITPEYFNMYFLYCHNSQNWEISFDTLLPSNPQTHLSFAVVSTGPSTAKGSSLESHFAFSYVFLAFLCPQESLSLGFHNLDTFEP